MIIKIILTAFVGFAGGIAVGAGFVAFLSVLGVIPRLTQITKTKKYIRSVEWSVILGAVAGGWFSLQDSVFYLSGYWLIPIGLACGTFVGMVAGALTEVLNVIPILAKRIGIDNKLLILLMAIVLGKITGSLFHWIYYVE